ncbi:unnamed protein product, partial [Laminaria digitata]
LGAAPGSAPSPSAPSNRPSPVVATGTPPPTPTGTSPPGGGGPYGGGTTPAEIPGLVEAEEFDTGGEGVGYSDTTAVNIGGAFRTDEGVDVSGTDDGYVVGWIESGEHLQYTVDVSTDGMTRDYLIPPPPPNIY